jgi:class 3 adenylate cyclase
MTFKADLEKEVREIFQASWKEREGRAVPDPEDLSLGNDAVKLKATVLYADMADSTDLVDHYHHPFAAEIYKAYLRSAARIIKNERGSITAYDGDRIMAVFLGDTKETSAVRSALKIHYAVTEIINPLMRKQDPNTKYQLKHVVGIDTSELFVARIGVKNDNDLVWVGRAANYAAKLCSLNGNYTTYITSAVFNAMDRSVKYGGNDNREPMWEERVWTARNSLKIYGSTWWWQIA